jgi:hypothetical protein
VTSDFNEFRNQLLQAEEMNPVLRDAFHEELSKALSHTLTPRSRFAMTVLSFVLVVFMGVGLRAMIFYDRGPTLLAVWLTFTTSCGLCNLWIAQTLWRGTFAWKSFFSIAELFTVFATIIAVLTLAVGAREPSNPASTFGVLYALVLLIVCVAWSLHARISAAELASREQMLRMEYRLADLAERLGGEPLDLTVPSEEFR